MFKVTGNLVPYGISLSYTSAGDDDEATNLNKERAVIIYNTNINTRTTAAELMTMYIKHDLIVRIIIENSSL